MSLEEKYQRAVEALKEISLGRGPCEISPHRFAVSVINPSKIKAYKTLVELGEAEEIKTMNLLIEKNEYLEDKLIAVGGWLIKNANKVGVVPEGEWASLNETLEAS